MSKPLPVLRPIVVAAALPLTLLACLQALGPAHRGAPAGRAHAKLAVLRRVPAGGGPWGVAVAP